jgi:MFS family permease
MAAEIDRTLEISSTSQRSALGLYLGAFFFAFQDNAAIIALPWLVMKLGGQELAVGSVGALTLGTYMVFCLLSGSRFGRLGAKRLSTSSACITCLILALMPLSPSVAGLLTLAAVKGMVMSAFWPPVMSWASAGVNGTGLNRRLGLFNLSWSSGAIVGSLLGGLLFKVVPWLPFVVSAGAALLAMIALLTVTEPHKDAFETAVESDPDGSVNGQPGQLVVFQWVSRLGLAFGWIAFAALRVPIASLFKELSLGAGWHAISSAGMSLLMLCGFYLLGRWAGWHYRFRGIVIAQLLLVAILMGVGLSGNPKLLFAFISLSALPFAFLYTSHLYYIVSGAGHRQGSAALHEILLALGFSIGSFGAGALGHGFGSMQKVYFVIAGVILLTLLSQAGIFLAGRKSPPNRK